MIRRGGVTDVPWFWVVAGNKVSHNFSTLHHSFNYGSDISQLRVLASHNTSLGSVAQGAWKLVSWEIRKCHFWSDPACLAISSKKKCL